jgi:hypothetical protein
VVRKKTHGIRERGKIAGFVSPWIFRKYLAP